MSEIQLPLFGESTIGRTLEVGKPVFSKWSHSRRAVLERCPRQYYYHYYGAILNKSNTDPQKDELNFLKNTLGNRHVRIGKLLHLVIRKYLVTLQQDEYWSLDRLLNWARKMYRRDLEYSRKYERGDEISDGDYPPTLLLEFYYGLPDAEFICSEAEKRLVAALANFVKSQTFAQFRAGACQESAQMEKRIHMKESRFTLGGAVDLLYWEDDRVVIVDWKTGSAGSNDDSLQMLAYAWWAKQKFGISPNQIAVHLAYLAGDTVSTFSISEKDLTRVEAKILQDLERMHVAHRYGQQSIADAFTPCAQPKVCASCQFQGVCPKE